MFLINAHVLLCEAHRLLRWRVDLLMIFNNKWHFDLVFNLEFHSRIYLWFVRILEFLVDFEFDFGIECGL